MFKKTSNEQYLNYIHDENESTNNNTCRIKVVLVGLCLAGEGWMVGLCLAGEGEGCTVGLCLAGEGEGWMVGLCLAGEGKRWMVGGICDFCLAAFLKRPFVKCVAIEELLQICKLF